MTDPGQNNELQACQKQVETLKGDLSQQIGYNCTVLVIGLVMGFIFAYIDRSKLFRKTK